VGVIELRELRQLREENGRLKRLGANLNVDRQILRGDLLKKAVCSRARRRSISQKLSIGDRKCEHRVILKIASTNICGSDQHMVRGRTTVPHGLILGHEITGEVVETGRDVEFIKLGDLCSVPFNIACGRCRNCRERATSICLNVPARPGAAYGLC
jgi:threonine dehydrogenase-like Zn-dependent dehydrogenase